ncbi:MAG TPA: trigger factor [Candidatus Eremiobacteraceae bacterium]|nr:trigger factor [Candidatus Eremiobacteraceae bacterium]
MTATVRKLAPTEVELDIEVSAPDFEAARERAFRKLVKQYRLPGFRQGHVPRPIFERHVGTEAIDHQAVEDVVPDAYSRALKEHNLDPVDRPHIDLERLDDGKSLRIKAKVSVRPDITLADYRGLALESHPVSVTEEEVERSLQALRKRAAELEPVGERGIEAGDVVTMDYVGTIDGEPFEGGSATDHTTEVNSEKFVPGFAEQLYGAKPGDKRTLKVTFPPHYHVETLAGKEATFDVTIHDVRQPVLPNLDEAFVKKVSEHESVDALRADIRKRLEAVGDAQAREAVQKQLITELLARHDFPLPAVLVDREVESLLADAKNYMQSIGRSWGEYLAAKGVDEQGLTAEYRTEAERRVKTALVLEEIARAEGIDVTTKDLESELDHLARSYGRSRDAMIDVVRRNTGFGPLIDSVRKQKTIEFLLTQADIRTAQGSLAGQS